MDLNHGKVSFYGIIVLLAVLANGVVLRNGLVVGNKWYWGLCFTLPLLLIAIGDFRSTKNKDC
jgi:hypothetical protein